MLCLYIHFMFFFFLFLLLFFLSIPESNLHFNLVLIWYQSIFLLAFSSSSIYPALNFFSWFWMPMESIQSENNSDDNFVALLVYVDDIVIIGHNIQIVDSFKVFLHFQFKLKDLGCLKYFLWIEIACFYHELSSYIGTMHYTCLRMQVIWIVNH